MPSPPKPTVPPEWGLRISEDEPLEQFRIQVHGALHGRTYERARSVYHFAKVEDDMQRFTARDHIFTYQRFLWRWRFYALLLLRFDPLPVHTTGHRVVTRT